MQQFDVSFGRFFFVGALAGAFVFSLPSATEAHHLQVQPQVETKVEMQGVRPGHSSAAVQHGVRPTPEGTTRVVPRSLNDRIQAILHPVEEPVPEMMQQVQVPKTVSAYDDSIIGTPLATQEQCVKYLLSYNPAPNISCTPQQLVSFYYQEGEREGIRPDVAFAQALKETGFFRYGGDVVPSQNNYCGLGTTGGGVRGAAFATPQLGVRAHIQHLLAYASTREPQEPVVDPRYSLVRGTYGDTTLGAWNDLNGRWAVPGNSYGQSILSMFRAILSE
ncbi:MAG: glucosaminidase domain-containing protein [Selenomonadaceae bacterium]|nr:glucosaminidase domain-containing protein [Selenomonadaceae bacterium]